MVWGSCRESGTSRGSLERRDLRGLWELGKRSGGFDRVRRRAPRGSGWPGGLRAEFGELRRGCGGL